MLTFRLTSPGERVDMTTLKAKGLVKKKTEVVRILGRGELTIALTLKWT